MVICGIHGIAERANSLFKTTFKALRRVSLDPASITRIRPNRPRPAPTGARPHHMIEDREPSRDITEKTSLAHRGTVKSRRPSDAGISPGAGPGARTSRINRQADSMYGLRVALWCVDLVAFGSLFFVMKPDLPKAVLLHCVVLAPACPVVAEGHAAWRRQSARQTERGDWYVQNFGSTSALRQVVDEPGLRRIRDEKGLVNAVRELRRQHPRLPLDVGATLVKEL